MACPKCGSIEKSNGKCLLCGYVYGNIQMNGERTDEVAPDVTKHKLERRGFVPIESGSLQQSYNSPSPKSIQTSSGSYDNSSYEVKENNVYGNLSLIFALVGLCMNPILLIVSIIMACVCFNNFNSSEKSKVKSKVGLTISIIGLFIWFLIFASRFA